LLEQRKQLAMGDLTTLVDLPAIYRAQGAHGEVKAVMTDLRMVVDYLRNNKNEGDPNAPN
jgi:hypothetical protein